MTLLYTKHRVRDNERERDREGKKKEGEREREKETQDRIKWSSSLITIHFFDYINARQKKNETPEV